MARARADDLEPTLELAQESGDAELDAEVDRERRRPRARLRPRADRSSSSPASTTSGRAILTISAGAGGTEATDWAAMLLRMYLRWAERHRWKTEVIDQQEGEQAGLKSVSVAVDGRGAYGWLRAERGVHRLVRISPFDAQNRRQTTFALVEVMPEPDEDVPIELDWDEIRVDTFRSQGAGGQHVNKTDSAVRLTHLPTGIVAQTQNERSQTQNKETAIKVLKARLLERALEEKEAELRQLRGEHVEAGWGNQIRSYVLHPYQMVKDLRTHHETANTSAVLDGDLDAFMQAELERLATGGGSARGDEGGRTTDDGRDRRRRGRLTDARAAPAPRPGIAVPPGDGRRPRRVRRHLARLDRRLPARGLTSPLPREPRGLLRLHAHPLATDPDAVPRRRAAATAAGGRRRVRVGGAARAALVPVDAVRRCRSRPGRPRRGAARAAPARRPATAALATCTDSAQPISNGAVRLARHRAADAARPTCSGGRSATATCPPLPRGIRAVRFDELDGGRPAERRPRRRSSDTLDRASRRVRATRRTTPSSPGGAAVASCIAAATVGPSAMATPRRSVGSGPIAVRDPDLLAPVLAHLLTAVVPRGASSVWLPGDAGGGDGGAAPGRLPDRGLSVPRLLGPPDRRLHQIRTDLAGLYLDSGRYLWCVVRYRGSTILGVRCSADPARSTALVAFGPTWLPSRPQATPRRGSSGARTPSPRTRSRA